MNRWARAGATALTLIAATAILRLWVTHYSVTGNDLEALLANMRVWTLPAIFVLLATHVAIAAIRWARIEEALGADRPSYRRAFTAGAVALGLGTFLPGFVTNVAARALSNRIDGGGAARGAVSGSIDQLSDLAIVFLILPAALLGIALNSLPAFAVAAAAICGIGYAALGFATTVLELLGKFSPRARRASVSIADLPKLRFIYGLSLLRFACLTAITLLIHVATGAGTASAAILAVAPVTVAVSVAMLPGGLGISEWSFSAVFSALGVDQQQAVLFVLGNRIILSIAAMALMTLAALASSFRGRNARVARQPLNV